MKTRVPRFVFLYLAILSITSSLCPASTTFQHIKIRRHRSPQNRVMVDKVGTLTFDDDHRLLNFASGAGDKVEVPYDSVVKIVFEVTSHMRGGALSQVVSAAGIAGAIAGTAIAGREVHDYWFYLEYKTASNNEPVLFEVPKGTADTVIEKTKNLFGEHVVVASFSEKGEEIKKDRLADLQSKQTLKVNKENHPLPELKPDKALVVVVCPPLAARYSGRGNQFKLHVNDHVIAVNKSGTYSFAYVDPGKYLLVSQSENANGFDIVLEAGKDYYFLQSTYQGAFKGHTVLSRNSKELVMYELSGAYFADWAPKEKQARAQGTN